MRKLRLPFALLAALAVAAPATADVITTGNAVTIADDVADSHATFNGGQGGTFILTGPSDSWDTFCLEVTEYLSFGPTYFVGGIGDAAMAGGGGAVNGADPLDFKTRAIYHHFRTTASAWSGADIQNAIWFYEQELGNSVIDNVVTQWATQQNPNAYNFGGYDVKVLNLWSARTGGNAQDLLTLQAVPEPVSMLLLGAGLLGLGAVRRR